MPLTALIFAIFTSSFCEIQSFYIWNIGSSSVEILILSAFFVPVTFVGDVEDCLVEPISQGQFTPLPEALCWIILDMTASGQAAVMESICSTLEVAFPDIQKPSKQLIYDTLAKLMAEKKVNFYIMNSYLNIF